jgi:hypothetical protein
MKYQLLDKYQKALCIPAQFVCQWIPGKVINSVRSVILTGYVLLDLYSFAGIQKLLG